MTKRETIHRALVRTSSLEHIVQQLLCLLDESRAMTHLRASDHFARALAIWLAALPQVNLAPWLDACMGMEKALGPLQQALTLLIGEGQKNYHDVLGAVYMRLSQGDKRLGQYFTPSGVAKMLAEMNLHDVQPPGPGEQPIRMYEPTCGSGVMILAAAEVIEQHFPGSILRGAIQFFEIDFDPLCVQIAQINMFLHGIGRVKQDPEGKSGEQATRSIPSDQPIRALFQPAKIIQGDALVADTETSQRFLEEERFPWFPLILLPPPSSPAPGDGQRDKRMEYPEQWETMPLFAFAPEAERMPAVSLSTPSPLPRGTRRIPSPLTAEDVIQPELFPPAS